MECPPSEENNLDINVSIIHQDLDEAITKWRDTAFQVALEKLIESNGTLETVMQTGEAFGRGLFSHFIIEKPKHWTMKDWTEHIAQKILHHLGHEININKITDVKATLTLHNSPLTQQFNEPHVASLFTYSTIRGLLKSAYPKGEVIPKSIMTNENNIAEFILKANTMPREKNVRELVKQYFITTKKL